MIQRSWQKRNYGRGTVKHTTVRLGLWTCESGHLNLDRKLIDERASGGFCYEVKVTACEQCGKERVSTPAL
jgi:hypothetical protein